MKTNGGETPWVMQQHQCVVGLGSGCSATWDKKQGWVVMRSATTSTGSARIHFLFDDVGRTINNPCALRQAQAPNEDLRNILRKSQNVRDQKGP